MKSFQVSVLCTALILGHFVGRGEAQGGRFCGKKLVNMVLKLCNNCVHDPGSIDYDSVAGKRSGGDNLEVIDPSDARLGYHLTSSADFYHPSKAKFKRGIVEDCCLNTCTYTYLKSYCCRA